MAPRPTRLVAWMYSEVVFGCPLTSMRPSRGTSTPTDSMLVEASRSMTSRVARRLFQPLEESRLSSSPPTLLGQLVDLESVGRRRRRPRCRASRAGMSSRAIVTVRPSSRSQLW